jgi:hypothetical protein
MPHPDAPQFFTARTMRGALLTQIEHYLKEAVEEPTTGRGMDIVLKAFEEAVASYERLVAMLSTSSHRDYAVRDLPTEERERFARVEHNLRIMRALYGAQKVI